VGNTPRPRTSFDREVTGRPRGGQDVQASRGDRCQAPFVEELPRLLHERGLSISAIARDAGVTPSYLSKVLRRAYYKTPSGALTAKVARSLGLPTEYFPEYREAMVVDRLKSDPSFRERIFDQLGAESGSTSV
jgi:transcriptional regulator with XRE-family HTH domain